MTVWQRLGIYFMLTAIFAQTYAPHLLVINFIGFAIGGMAWIFAARKEQW